MKKILFPLVIMTMFTGFMSFVITIPNVEFNIQFLNHTTGTPTLSVNGVSTASSTAPHFWSAFVDGPIYSSVFNFTSNKCYTIKGVGANAKQNLCITFKPNYNPSTDQPTVTYDVISKTFTANGGANCSYKISKFVCCLYKDAASPK
ncbi:MAG TPA: hypothetical protein PLD02_11385 [Saprospiraceae bacterium]|nr:hypothetical protein [Saprospiraceae bacterium]